MPRAEALWFRCRQAPRGLSSLPAGLAIVTAIITVTSTALLGAHFLAPFAHASNNSDLPTPALTGTQLQQGPFVTPPAGTSQLASNPATKILGPADPSATMMFTVGFPLKNAAGLQALVNAEGTPGNPLYRHWLTLDQESQMFGPDPGLVSSTVNYFTSMGFKVETRGLISVSFSGTVAQTDSAFRTTLVNVAGSNGTYMANAGDLSLPAAIASGIATINGLNTRPVAHTELFVSPEVATLASAAGLSVAVSPLSSPPPTNNSAVLAAFNFTNHAFLWIYSPHHHYDQFISASTLDYIYNASPLLNAGYIGNSTGTRISIAIVMGGGINPDDLETFSQVVWGNPYQIFNPVNPALSRLTAVPVDGTFTTNGTLHYSDGLSNELALDIEYSSTMAPGARILPVYGPCLCTNILDDDYARILSMTPIPNIVTNSWGGDEDAWPNLYGPNWNNVITMHNYFLLIDARGSSVLASSGDGGGFDVGTGMLAPSYPASDPAVLSVNGIRTAVADRSGQIFPTNTNLGTANITFSEEPNQPTAPGYLPNYPTHIASAQSIAYQQFWYVPFSNETLLRAPPAASGGMGTSLWFNQSWWQHGPNIPDLGRGLGSGVAAEADFNESIFFDGGFEYFFGGTSFACPTTAGEFALVDDYLLAHGLSPYLGDANIPVWEVANAWYNGNLTLKPFDDVTLGASYWANQGESNQWAWPPGQEFPRTANGYPDYGNTSVGWDFPTGWGSLDVNNFAVDLATLEQLPGQFAAVSGTSWAPNAWPNFAVNHTYTIHVNATSSLISSNPSVTVVYHAKNGPTTSVRPTLTQVGSPSVGYDFTFDTTAATFGGPGYVVFEIGNASAHTAGFAYAWVAPTIPSGTLKVTVVAPQTGAIPGGYAEYNAWLGWFGPWVDPDFGPFYPNSFAVNVQLNGKPVYDAVVLANIASVAGLPAWAGSQGQALVNARGATVGGTTLIMSQSFTNLTGDALVTTWNVQKPTVYFINATYGPNRAQTSYNVTPQPNLQPVDNYGGQYSQFNFLKFVETFYRLPTTQTYQNIFVPNSVNQSDYYSMVYAWQGEKLTVKANDYQGNPLSAAKVWLGNWDIGYRTHFYHYEATFGVNPVTNATGTSAISNLSGDATIQIPDNQSTRNGFFFVAGPEAGKFVGFAFVAVDVPGQASRMLQYTEPCSPSNAVPTPLITCEFNDSFQRGYAAAPMFIFPNPLLSWTQTGNGVHRDFFNQRSTIGWGVNVSLPWNDPLLGGFGTNWNPGFEHITSALAYVDGIQAGNLTPVFPGVQNLSASQNLTGSWAPGTHVLTVVVTDSLGHTFTVNHTFLVGDVSFTDISQTNLANTYTQLPFNLTWSVDIPAAEVNNRSFSQSLEIDYITGGCGGASPCPIVVNYTEKIHNGQTAYLQNLNQTLLTLRNFYSGAGGLPPGQYRLTVWLNANHSGSTSAVVTTYFVFSPLQGAITGPATGASVPLGNLTISYTYSGQYITGATLYVYHASNMSSPIYTVGAVVPGIGIVGGARTWTSVQTGEYAIVLALSTPYATDNVTSYVNVTSNGATVFNNATAGGIFGIGNIALGAVLVALVGAVVGLLLGRYVLGRGQPTPSEDELGRPITFSEKAGGPTARTATANPAGTIGAHGISCSDCQESFETPGALLAHRQIAHATA